MAFERGMDRGMRLTLGEQPAQRRKMRHAVDRMGRREISRRAEIKRLDGVMAEMLVEPRPPGRAQRIARLQHAAQPRAGAAAHQAEMPAVLARHQFENDARLAMALDAEHDAFIGPLHGLYLVRLVIIREGAMIQSSRSCMRLAGLAGMTIHSFGNSNPISR